MKYLLIILIAIALVRIDDILNFVNRQSSRLESKKSTQEMNAGVTDLPPMQMIPINQDKSLQISSQQKFLLTLEAFLNQPSPEIAKNSLDILRQNPTMFNNELNADLAMQLRKFRNHMLLGNAIVMQFLLDVSKSLIGENLKAMRKVLSVGFDADLDSFLQLYYQSSDSNCIIASELFDDLPEDEIYNEIFERKKNLNDLLLKEGYPEVLKNYANRCLIVTDITLDKFKKTEAVP